MTTDAEEKFNHPCRGTCSGWQQGYERGHAEGCRGAEERIRELEESLEELVLAAAPVVMKGYTYYTHDRETGTTHVHHAVTPDTEKLRAVLEKLQGSRALKGESK